MNQITHHQRKLIEASVNIAENPDEAETAFMARQLVQATLPHSNPGDVPVWSRRNGDLILSIQPGFEQGKSLGIPYGTIPRLLLFWITTNAVQKRERRLELGNSLAEFMGNLDLIPSGGQWGTIHRLRKQMKSLFTARMSFDYTKKNKSSWLNMDIAPMGELWWDYKKPMQGNFWQSWIELGEKFYESIIAAPIPVDMRALKAIKRSPLALDLYAWLSYRTFIAAKKGKNQFISWHNLEKQLGCNYQNTRHFKVKVRQAIRKIELVYPELLVAEIKDKNHEGLEVKPSQTAIKPR